jgi:hypothetical protein
MQFLLPRITYHLNDAMDNSLTKWQASEMLMQLALCRLAKRLSAIPVVKTVFEKRAR